MSAHAGLPPPLAAPFCGQDFKVYYRPRPLPFPSHSSDGYDGVTVAYRPPPRASTNPTEDETNACTSSSLEGHPPLLVEQKRATSVSTGVRRVAKRKTRGVNSIASDNSLSCADSTTTSTSSTSTASTAAGLEDASAASKHASSYIAGAGESQRRDDSHSVKQRHESGGSRGEEDSTQAAQDDDDDWVTLAEAEQVYKQVKEQLDLCQDAPGKKTGREENEEEMARFWQEHVLQRKAGSLYVSGSPGTGKTLTLHRVIERMKKWEKKTGGGEASSQVIELNGMHMQAGQIEDAILKALGGARGKRLEDLLTDPRRPHMTVVILDELDQLIMAKQTDILYKLFEIVTLPKSSLVFIGVANALRLKESLPLLQTAKYGDVKQMTFESYNSTQLLDILKVRQERTGYRIFDDPALQLCASQAGKMSGDARKTLRLAKLAVEGALKDLPRTWGSQPRRKLPRVSMLQMHQAMTGALGQVSKRTEQIRALPTHQQLILCCLVVARGQLAARVAGPLPWKKVFDTYKAVSTRDGFGAVTPSEFCDMCAALEGHALISTIKAKGSLQGLLLQVSDNELRSAVQQTRALARVLSDAT